MINIGKLLDACGISYTDKQLSKLDNLVNKLLKKLSLQQFDANETTPNVSIIVSTSGSLPDSVDNSRNEDFASETKLKSMEELDFKHEPYYNSTIKEEIQEEIEIEIKEECPKDPFASLETFDDSESGESIKSFVCDTHDASFKLKLDCISHIATVHEGKNPLSREPCTSDNVPKEYRENNKSFISDTCDANFRQMSDCISHIPTVHEGKKLKSNYIATVSSPNIIIDQHKASSSNTVTLKHSKELITKLKSKWPALTLANDNSLKCPKCNFETSRQHSLDLHVQSSHISCEQCGQVFYGHRAKSQLAGHLKKHQVQFPKQYLCYFCKKDCLYKQNIKKHMKICHKRNG